MRVAIITESFPPDVNGVAHSVQRVAELLASSGHHPLVIAPQPPRKAPHAARDLGDPEQFPYPVVRVPAVPLPGYPSFRLGLPSHRVRDALIQHRAEIVHLASPVFLGAHGAYFGMLAKLDRIKAGAKENVWIDPSGYLAAVAEREQAFETELKRQEN